MITKTSLKVDPFLITKAIEDLSNTNLDFKSILNYPTDNFFYNFWCIKPEFNGTIWEEILKTLPSNIGEARIIRLEPETCYVSHADIDDRYHLNLQGENSFLIDIENEKMYQCKCDSKWYDMDAGILHTATNFGNFPRVQLVVRKLLLSNVLNDPIKIEIIPNSNNQDDVRYAFDSKLSPWLNRANKKGIINNFYREKKFVKFNLEKEYLKDLIDIIPSKLKMRHDLHY
jgi:hypothetical protein